MELVRVKKQTRYEVDCAEIAGSFSIKQEAELCALTRNLSVITGRSIQGNDWSWVRGLLNNRADVIAALQALDDPDDGDATATIADAAPDSGMISHVDMVAGGTLTAKDGRKACFVSWGGLARPVVTVRWHGAGNLLGLFEIQASEFDRTFVAYEHPADMTGQRDDVPAAAGDGDVTGWAWVGFPVLRGNESGGPFVYATHILNGQILPYKPCGAPDSNAVGRATVVRLPDGQTKHVPTDYVLRRVTIHKD